MNVDETRRAIDVMQHYANGGDVQVRKRSSREWVDFDRRAGGSPSWDWWENDYRPVPRVPREFVVALDHAGNSIGVGGADVGAPIFIVRDNRVIDVARSIRVREIIE